MTAPADTPDDWLLRESAKLRAARAAHPGHSIFFPALGDVSVRRQVVRWIGNEYDHATPGILEVLRSGLLDKDWEVRASAIIVASRLHAIELRSVVREADLPSAGQFGLDEIDVQLLIAARFVASALLGAARDAREAESIVAADFPSLRYDLAALVRCDTAPPSTRLQLLLHALLTPVPLRDELPVVLPTGIDVRDDRAFLAGTDIGMLWIAPGDFILGGDVSEHSTTTGIRNWVLSRGYFISRRPMRACDATACGVAAVASEPVNAEIQRRLAAMVDPPLMATYDHAEAICQSMSFALNTQVVQPIADELECAARGADGRRYPWGNGMQRLTGREESPTNLVQFAAPTAQWVQSPGSHAARLSLGGPASPYCAARESHHTVAALRLVVRTD